MKFLSIKEPVSFSELHEYFSTVFPDSYRIDIYEFDYNAKGWCKEPVTYFGKPYKNDTRGKKMQLVLDNRMSYMVYEGEENTYVHVVVEDTVTNEWFVLSWGYKYDSTGQEYIVPFIDLLHQAYKRK